MVYNIPYNFRMARELSVGFFTLGRPTSGGVWGVVVEGSTGCDRLGVRLGDGWVGGVAADSRHFPIV